MVSVMINGRECTDLSVRSPIQVRCYSPPGVGKKASVRLETRLGLVVETDDILGYRAPAITRTDPAYAMMGPVIYDFAIYGSEFGRAGVDGPPVVTVGERTCRNVSHVNSTLLRCFDVPATAGWLSDKVSVAVGDQTAVSESVFVGHARPNLQAVGPSSGPTDGGFNITITGESIGSFQNDIASLHVGDRACLRVVHRSSRQVVCTVPPGAGRDLVLRLNNSLGTASIGEARFSYDSPSITSLSPTRVLTGPVSYDFVLHGQHLAAPESPADGLALIPPQVSIGGNPCGEIVVVNSSVIECNNVSAASWGSSTVELELEGQATASFTLLETVRAPVVTGASPSRSSTRGGVTLDVQGLGFGGRSDDVAIVTVGGRQCGSVNVVSDRLLRCTLPAGVGSRLNVEVVNSVGKPSREAPVFSYDPPALQIITPPIVLTAPDNSTRLDVIVTGSSLASGNASDSPPAVVIGGLPCEQLDVISTTVLRCRDLDASGWASGRVSVSIGG